MAAPRKRKKQTPIQGHVHGQSKGRHHSLKRPWWARSENTKPKERR